MHHILVRGRTKKQRQYHSTGDDDRPDDGVLKDFLAGAELVSVMADINGKW
ncbi:hypothetical protein [Moraxella bovis]|uniref:hypothetical protein n=1 Tax=Moraxella bovis TaxID=476 RepID=UPI0015F1A391|nr:hypothetical protein [Moraxella bovis]